jgi:hypothetical protein
MSTPTRFECSKKRAQSWNIDADARLEPQAVRNCFSQSSAVTSSKCECTRFVLALSLQSATKIVGQMFHTSTK